MSWKEDLDVFFRPKSIAIVGAPSEQTAAHYFLLNSLRAYTDKVYPINPNHPEIAGVKTYKSIKEIGEPIDFAAIAVPARLVPKMLEECRDIGVKAGIVYAAGFAEAENIQEGVDMQKAIAELCEKGQMRMCGPNCMGMINNIDKFVAMNGRPMLPGGVALITQSGALGLTLEDRLTQKGVGISHVISSGNETVITAGNYISYLIRQPQVRAIGIYMETVNSPKDFFKSAEEARKLRKPIVVVKTGKTELGARRAMSHTGSLAGSYEVFKGVMKQHGVIVADSLDYLIENLTLLTKVPLDPRIAKGGVAFQASSGGGLALLADGYSHLGFTPPNLYPETIKELSKVLPPFANISNPLDVAGDGGYNPTLYTRCLSILAKDPSVSILVYLAATTSPSDKNIIEILAQREKLGKPLVVLTQVAGSIDKEALDVVTNNPVLQGLEFGLSALRNLFWYCKKLEPAASALTTTSEKKLDSSIQSVTLAQGFGLLEDYEIPVAEWRLVRTAVDVTSYADELGYPLVLKPNSSAILHKSDVGMVRANIRNRQELEKEYEWITKQIRNYTSDTSVVLQSMIHNGTEVAIGAFNDALFGPAIMVGLGGVFIEALKDYSVRLPPIAETDASEMIDELKSKELLRGFRGKTGVNIQELNRILTNFSRLVQSNLDVIREIDVNPLISSGDTIRAVDVRMVPAFRNSY